METNADTSNQGHELAIKDSLLSKVAVPALENDDIVSSIYRVVEVNGHYSLDYFPVHELPIDPDSFLLFLNLIVKAGVSANHDSWLKELAAGRAFKVLRERELWKRLCSCKNLKEYCLREYNRTLSTLLDWERAADMNDFIGPNPTTLPEKYSQVLALECIIPALRQFVWETAAAENGGHAPSGPLVRKIGERENALTPEAKLELEARRAFNVQRALENEKTAPNRSSSTFAASRRPLATAHDAVAPARNIQARLEELCGADSGEVADMTRILHFLEREASKLEQLPPPQAPKFVTGPASTEEESQIAQPIDPFVGKAGPSVVQNSRDTVPNPPSVSPGDTGEAGRIIRPAFSDNLSDASPPEKTRGVPSDEAAKPATPALPPAKHDVADKKQAPAMPRPQYPIIINTAEEATIQFADKDQFLKYKNDGRGFIPQRFGFEFNNGLWRFVLPT